MSESPTQSPRSVNAWRVIVVLALLLIVVAAFRSCGSDSGSQSTAPARQAAVTRRAVTSEEFTIVRNDCGLCGTNSPVGGWETEDGRALVLDADGSFMALFDDGTSAVGTWEKSGNELCLSSFAGDEVCQPYRQLVDAMKLGNAIYIRE